jgi:hypothetical protein
MMAIIVFYFPNKLLTDNRVARAAHSMIVVDALVKLHLTRRKSLATRILSAAFMLTL